VSNIYLVRNQYSVVSNPGVFINGCFFLQTPEAHEG